MTIAIHQPNFFPWLGFFNKIYKSNVFVYLNHVVNNPRSAIYTKRVKIIVNQQEHWLTCNLKSEANRVFVPINEMVIDKPERLKDKHLKTIELSYKKAPYFSQTFSLIEAFYNHPSELIAERNVFFINKVCKSLNIGNDMILSKDMNLESSSNQLLIDIIKTLKADSYMPGGGASDYQVDELFLKNNIKLVSQNFVHPIYNQFNSAKFVSGLSIIDALMNVGFLETELLVKK